LQISERRTIRLKIRRFILNGRGVGMLYGNNKMPNKKENWPKSFPRDYLWTLGKRVALPTGCYIIVVRHALTIVQHEILGNL